MYGESNNIYKFKGHKSKSYIFNTIGYLILCSIQRCIQQYYYTLNDFRQKDYKRYCKQSRQVQDKVYSIISLILNLSMITLISICDIFLGHLSKSLFGVKEQLYKHQKPSNRKYNLKRKHKIPWKLRNTMKNRRRR